MQVQPAFQDRTMYIPTTCSRRLPWGFASGVSPGQKILFPGTNQRSFVVHLAAAKRFPFPIIPKDMSKLPTKAANNAMHRNALWQLQNLVSLTSPTWVTPSKIHMVIRTLFLLLFLFLNFHINPFHLLTSPFGTWSPELRVPTGYMSHWIVVLTVDGETTKKLRCGKIQPYSVILVSRLE